VGDRSGQHSIRTNDQSRIRPARDFGTSDLFWLNLQTRHDLEIAKDRLGTRLDEEVPDEPSQTRCSA
jgi:plasmid maintenance system antidote protein VapI